MEKRGTAAARASGVRQFGTGVEHHDFRTDELEGLVRREPLQTLALVEPHFKGFDQFPPQVLQVREFAGIDDGQPLGQFGIVQAVPGPGGEIVVVFGLLEPGRQQAAQKW